MACKISIIVPVYNVEKYLKYCIDSILSQTFKSFEIILVNDGSTDKSGIICDEYAKKDNRIKVIHKKNGGLSSARNAGIDIAKGEYIGFIDSDDYIHKDMYNILYKEAVKSQSDITICDYLKVYENGKDINLKNNERYVYYYNNIDALNELYGRYSIQFIVAWNKLYKKSIFKDLRYELNKIHEDEFIIHKLLYNSKKIAYVDCKLYYYLQRDNSIMNNKFNVKNLDIVYALNDRSNFFRDLNLYDLKFKAEYFYTNSHFKYYYKSKYELFNAKKELWKLKRIFRGNFKFIIKNPMFCYKYKIKCFMFCLNPRIYEAYYKIRGIRLDY